MDEVFRLREMAEAAAGKNLSEEEKQMMAHLKEERKKLRTHIRET